MEVWLLLFASLCFCALVQYVVSIFLTRKLPPSPPTIPFFGNLLWLLKSSKDFAQIEPILHHMRMKYGPIVTLYIGSRPAIFLTTHASAHQALVQSGSIFASRPNLETTNVLLNNQCTLTSTPYGLLWRIFRQNFMSTLHPCKLHLYSDGRVWALNIFRDKLLPYLQNINSNYHVSSDSMCDMILNDEPDMDSSKYEKEANKGVPVLEQFRYAFFCLMVYILFGENFEEDVIKEIEEAQQTLLTNFIRFNVLNFMPRLGKIVFRKIWKDLLKIQQSQQNIFLPLIKARREKMNKIVKDENVDNCFYVDSLLHLQLPQEYGSRKLLDDEIVCFCSEFLTAGTDTSIATFQWVMANLVKYQDIQEKLYEEITSVVKKEEDISESDLQNMIFLRSIILETLRRHPPAHFMIPHAVTEDTKLGGYHIPKNAMVNVTLAELGRDPNVWDNPLEFKPERFFDNNGKIDFDLKGVKEIKMIPFGAGIRSCPAITMALLHLQFFVANMVRDFKWVPIQGEEIDLTEKQDFSIVMKNPLRAQFLPRIN